MAACSVDDCAAKNTEQVSAVMFHGLTLHYRWFHFILKSIDLLYFKLVYANISTYPVRTMHIELSLQHQSVSQLQSVSQSESVS